MLGALWFVPSANASDEAAERAQVNRTQQVAAVAHTTGAVRASHATAEEPAGLTAETGAGVDSTPYVIGGTALLGLGAGFVTYAVRRPPAAGRDA